MKAIKRIIASVFVCMFAVTGGLNALALTPTEDSSTVVSQPVSEGISSETSSQTGSVSSGLSSRADDSGLKNESSSSRTPEASSEVDSENSLLQSRRVQETTAPPFQQVPECLPQRLAAVQRLNKLQLP